MARNVEVKAKIKSWTAVRQRAERIADQGPFELQQDDTFFQCDRGRLKLREFADGRGELIFYQRPIEEGPKESFYVLSQTPEPSTLREVLSLAFGVVGRVRKRRILFLVGRTRIHLDQVEGLGEFLELEVVLREDEPLQSGLEEARRLMQELDIPPDQLIDCAYIDLITANKT